MKRYMYIIFTIILTACGASLSDNKGTPAEFRKVDAMTNLYTTISADDDLDEDTTDYNYATYFIVIVDTSLHYHILQEKMFNLSRQLNIAIDTMGRYYDKTEDLIKVPDDDEDEVYAGGYFPRRFPSDNLSLEYLSYYQSNAGEKTIALMAGIYETEESADSALTVLYKTDKKAFKIKSELYVGCTH